MMTGRETVVEDSQKRETNERKERKWQSEEASSQDQLTLRLTWHMRGLASEDLDDEAALPLASSSLACENTAPDDPGPSPLPSSMACQSEQEWVSGWVSACVSECVCVFTDLTYFL